MAMKSRMVAATALWLAGAVPAAWAAGIDFSVTETAGILRYAYPVNTQVPFDAGALKDASHIRLMLEGREVAAQFTTRARWADGSVKTLDLDFNAPIAPLEQQNYRVEFGDDVTPAAVFSGHGLNAIQTADAITVGPVRFGKTPSPLIASVAYRQEDIGKGLNGFTVTDANGATHDLNAEAVTAEIVKPGPIDALIRYTGNAIIDGSYSVGFVVTVEMPNSKSWVRYSASVDDPAKRIRSIAFHAPMALGSFPWLWDFGTGSWSYGAFHDAADSVTLTQNAAGWKIETSTKGQTQLYETAAGQRPKIAEGWGHFQDAKEVIAFGFDKFGRVPGTDSVSFNGQGEEIFQHTPARPAARHQLTIYQHYVASPAPIGAVTSPASMLHPLVVRLADHSR